MSKGQRLRALVEQRLAAAAEEIFGLFERTIAEYEEEASRSNQENDRQRKLLDAVINQEVLLHRAVLPPDLQQLLVSKEEVPPEQQEWRPSLDQEDLELPHIKEEQEELRVSQEGEQLQGLEEADITKFPFTPVSVKIEDDEDKPQSSQLHQSSTKENRKAEPLASCSTEQMKTEADGEDCGESEPDRNLDPATDLQPTRDGKTSHCSETKTEHSDLMQTWGPQSGLDSLIKNEVLVNRPYTGEKRFSCSVCGKRFHRKDILQRHIRIHTGEKPFSCSVCGKAFIQKVDLLRHMRVHTGEKPHSCSVCRRRFTQRSQVKTHKCVVRAAGEGAELLVDLNHSAVTKQLTRDIMIVHLSG